MVQCFHAEATYDTDEYQTPQRLYDAIEEACGRGALAAADHDRGCVELLIVGRRACKCCVPGLRVHSARTLLRGGERVLNHLMQMRGGAGEADDRLLDAYRLLSGGDMHPYDKRKWRMTSAALRRMRGRLRHDDAILDALHAHYSRLLHEHRDEAAHALTHSLLSLSAEAGGMHEVLQRQARLRGCK